MMAEAPDFERLRSIKTLPQLIAYLRDELGWPLNGDDLDDVTFDYDPSELGFDKAASARIKEIKQFRPLETGQPWGIFWINFEKKNLPIVVLRRILANLAIKKRPSARRADRPAWDPNDLLFISAYGEDRDRAITFAHFSQDPDSPADLPVLKVLGWDDADSVLHIAEAHEQLTEKLGWPDNPSDVKEWREGWAAAFKIKHREVVSSTQELVKELAGLAQRVHKRANNVLSRESSRGPMRRLHNAFKETLIHDLKEDDFADVIAQTVSYGLLVARFSKPGEITAQNLVDMIPPTNPFLRELLSMFLSVAGRKQYFDFDELGIQEVIELLNRVNPDAVKADFGDRTRGEDPVIHFYEHFLAAYDKKKKVKRGVFFTPQSVVSYIVRSIHELLQTDFGIEDGLASTITWGEMASRNSGLKIPEATLKDDFFVVVLDPAVGTATFLVEVIEVIFTHLKKNWDKKGVGAMPRLKAKETSRKWSSFAEYWNAYVPTALLPRLYGYELMVAPYTIAHMKLDLKFSEINARLGQKERRQKYGGRANIYLTNSLEPATDSKKQIEIEELAPALAHEAQAVNEIKRKHRFTVVIGNPPYANYGQLNKNPFILGLLEDYKRGLSEKKLNLDDDFIKFVRFSEHTVNQTSTGILGMITNNTFLDGVTRRRMREHLTGTFDQMYVLDLHGNSIEREVCSDGSPDINVFDIQQGVAISIFANRPVFPSKRSTQLLRLFDLQGTRKAKYKFLLGRALSNTAFRDVKISEPLFLFNERNRDIGEEYSMFLSLPSILRVCGSGVKTDRDDLCFDFDRRKLSSRMKTAFSGKWNSNFVAEFKISDSSSYNLTNRLQAMSYDDACIRRCLYRLFDERWLYYEPGFTSRPAWEVMQHMVRKNLGFVAKRQAREGDYNWFFICRGLMVDGLFSIDNKGREQLFPLYSYGVGLLNDKTPNISTHFSKALAKRLRIPIDRGLPHGIDAEEIFSFIYAVVHSSSYRNRYSDYLRTDFPRIPVPATIELFGEASRFGGELIGLHLVESPKLDDFITTFTGPKNPAVVRVGWSDDTVWLDAAQTKKGQPAKPGTIGFVGVPKNVWNFHIGGYQVCEKWLKDRGPKKGNPGRFLTDEDINHYQKIIVALNETIRIMKEIDEVIEDHGGWPGAFK